MNGQIHHFSHSTGIAQFRLEAITTAEDLQAFKAEWDALFALDPDAGVFLSYDWLAPGLLANPNRWRIFVMRDPANQPVCIFPTKQRVHWSKSSARFQTEIEAAGRLAWGEYTGFICHPDVEEDALIALAQGLRSRPWKTLRLRYEPTLRRSKVFADAFGEGFENRFRPYRINKGEIDNLVSLKVPLEDGFENILTSRMSANSRQKIRRYRRKLLDTGTYHITTATPQTLERDIAGLLRHWLSQWAGQKGTDEALEIAERYGRALLTADAMDSLYLPVLWQGRDMLGALGHVLDQARGEVHFLVAGRNAATPDPAIGLLLHAHSLEWAAEAGFKRYDFGHGDQSYKQSFGPLKEESHYLTLRRRDDTAVFDPISLAPALKRLAEFAERGKTDQVVQAAHGLARAAGGFAAP